MTKRAYQERFYPTAEQAELLARSFGCARFVWNNTLKHRTDAFYQNGEVIPHWALEKRLVQLKQDFSWLNEVSSVIFQQLLRDQQQAFKHFWEKRAGYPRFKSKHRGQSIRLTKAAFRFKDGQLFIAKSSEPLNIHWSFKDGLPSEPSAITISKDAAGRYFVSMLCEFESEPMPVVNKTVGIDLGLKDLFVTSDGFKSGNPKYIKQYEAKLAYLQRKLAKKRKGSRNRNKLRLKVARVHTKIADCRRDATHKATRTLINENQVVCVESLAVKNMIKHPRLAKPIADANWGEFVRQLKYKAQGVGRTVVEIDRGFPNSKRCPTPGCGHINETLPLEVREWRCPSCGSVHDRDIAAAINIKTAGLAGLASGATGTGATTGVVA
ncbi:transposase, IS605 OrfB family [Nitrosococcus halophilus Nc 4]|uniref:Transposase, IS605 OrfB family n=1 Tax=Nitrosococcus halophilus (strain Nc4) TaxID=472759 RepID=D5BZ35_NITHN|nr:RNA-guided endonuclease TnpB family protein [Nitrosococcus halophilus]ADE14248.1 transposase, IS605 OrfB family [Nitrosococcus halophilus Nc 4]